MFVWLGRWAYRARYAVIVVFVGVMGLSGLYGMGYDKLFAQGGFYDDTSSSVAGSHLADSTFGRDTRQDIVALYTAPPGHRLDDPDITANAKATYARIQHDFAGQIVNPQGFWDSPTAANIAGDKARTHGFVSIGLRGDTDTDRLANYNKVKGQFAIPGTQLQLAGLMPLSGALNDGMAKDTQRAEAIALPLVAILLFIVFGGVVAAVLPVFIGGLTIIGSQGIVRFIMNFTPVNGFAGSVVTLIGLGLAIDYGLFTVSRFREEIAEGASTEDAVRTTVATAGRTIVFSATIIVICLGALLIFPIVFLKSLAYGAIAAVILAAVLAITVLPAILAVLGLRIDAFGLKRLSRTKTAAQIDASFWSRLALSAMKRPVLVAIPIILLLIVLVAPFFRVQFGGLSEKYLSPDNPARVSQEHFDALFPGKRTDPIKLIVVGADNELLSAIVKVANETPGLAGKGFEPDQMTTHGVNELAAGLVDKDHDADRVINRLRSLQLPPGVTMFVAGTPALERDAIHGLIHRLPLLMVILAVASFVMMFLAFGSFVLPIKAMAVSLLSLTATLGFLTVVFYDGIGASLLNVTPGPLMFAVLIIIVSLVFGLSTDYEIFLMSRMTEARARGADTREAIRYGIAHTGGIITAAAAILIVVTGAFAFSDIAMMQYLAYGMIAALILDATIIRMLLVPAVMKILGDACWWAPAWARRLQAKAGFAEHNSPAIPQNEHAHS